MKAKWSITIGHRRVTETRGRAKSSCGHSFSHVDDGRLISYAFPPQYGTSASLQSLQELTLSQVAFGQEHVLALTRKCNEECFQILTRIVELFCRGWENFLMRSQYARTTRSWNCSQPCGWCRPSTISEEMQCDICRVWRSPFHCPHRYVKM